MTQSGGGFRAERDTPHHPPRVHQRGVIAVGLGYGLLAESADGDSSSWLFSLFMLVSLMHFWYDGFIWSVARKQV